MASYLAKPWCGDVLLRGPAEPEDVPRPVPGHQAYSGAPGIARRQLRTCLPGSRDSAGAGNGAQDSIGEDVLAHSGGAGHA